MSMLGLVELQEGSIDYMGKDGKTYRIQGTDTESARKLIKDGMSSSTNSDDTESDSDTTQAPDSDSDEDMTKSKKNKLQVGKE